MALKAFLAAAAAAAIAVGLALPVRHNSQAATRESQIASFQPGHG
jgi:hypothetical protein